MRRTAIRTAAFDWAAMTSKLATDGAKAEVSRLRGVAGEVAALSKMYSAPPPPIDFAAYKAKITAVDVVDKLQENYMKLEYPTMADLEKAPVGTEKADIKTTAAKLIEEAEASVAESQERIVVLKALAATMESNKMGYHTTLDQLYELYPEMQAEIEDEINNHEWGKDIS